MSRAVFVCSGPFAARVHHACESFCALWARITAENACTVGVVLLCMRPFPTGPVALCPGLCRVRFLHVGPKPCLNGLCSVDPGLSGTWLLTSAQIYHVLWATFSDSWLDVAWPLPAGSGQQFIRSATVRAIFLLPRVSLLGIGHVASGLFRAATKPRLIRLGFVHARHVVHRKSLAGVGSRWSWICGDGQELWPARFSVTGPRLPSPRYRAPP